VHRLLWVSHSQLKHKMPRSFFEAVGASSVPPFCPCIAFFITSHPPVHDLSLSSRRKFFSLQAGPHPHFFFFHSSRFAWSLSTPSMGHAIWISMSSFDFLVEQFFDWVRAPGGPSVIPPSTLRRSSSKLLSDSVAFFQLF